MAELSPRVYKALGLISSNQLRKKNRNSLFTDSSLVFIIHTCNEKINADFLLLFFAHLSFDLYYSYLLKTFQMMLCNEAGYKQTTKFFIVS